MLRYRWLSILLLAVLMLAPGCRDEEGGGELPSSGGADTAQTGELRVATAAPGGASDVADVSPESRQPGGVSVDATAGEPDAPDMSVAAMLARDLNRLCTLAGSSSGKGLRREDRMVWIGQRYQDEAESRKGWGVLELIATSPPEQGCLMLRTAGRQAGLGDDWGCEAFCPMAYRFGEKLLGDVRLPASTSLRVASEAVTPLIIGQQALRTRSLDLAPVTNGRVDEVFKTDQTIRALNSMLRVIKEGEVFQVIADADTRASLLAETLRTAARGGFSTFELLVQGGGLPGAPTSPVAAWSVGEAVAVPLGWAAEGAAPTWPAVRLMMLDDGIVLTSWSSDGTPTHHSVGACNTNLLMFHDDAATPIEVPAAPAMICLRDDTAAAPRDRHDWVALYNTLLEIKKQPEFAALDAIEVTGSEDITLDLLLAALDLSRDVLITDPSAPGAAPLADAAALVSARPGSETLFPDAIISGYEESIARRPLQLTGPAAYDAILRGGVGAPTGAAVRFDASGFSIAGDYDRAFIEGFIVLHREAFLQCLGTATPPPGEAWSADVSWTITEVGTISSVAFHHSTLTDTSIESCLANVIGQWQLPAPSDGSAVTISDYHFEFRSD